MAASTDPLSVASLKNSLSGDRPPAGAEGPVAALWHIAKGDIQRARQILKGDESKAAALVKAHMLRRKGKHEKAAKWYANAGKEIPTTGPEAEWDEIAGGLLLHMQ